MLNVILKVGFVAVLGMIFGGWGVAAGIALLVVALFYRQALVRTELEAARLQLQHEQNERLAAIEARLPDQDEECAFCDSTATHMLDDLPVCTVHGRGSG